MRPGKIKEMGERRVGKMGERNERGRDGRRDDKDMRQGEVKRRDKMRGDKETRNGGERWEMGIDEEREKGGGKK